MRKGLISVFVFLLVGCLLVDPCFGLLSSHPTGYYDFDSNVLCYNHPSSQLYVSGVGQIFNVSGLTIENIVVYGKTSGNPNLNMTMKIGYSDDGVDHADAVPNATVVATSTNVLNSTTDVTSAMSALVFNFTAFTVTSGMNYTFWIECSGGPDSFTNGVTFEWDHTSPAAVGHAFIYYSSGWTAVADDMIYYVYSEGEFDGGGGGSQPPYVPEGDSDDVISGLMWWLIYLVVLLLPSFLLGFWMKMGKWGFVIGLAIGAGVGYGFIPGFPLWLLVLVAVGEFGLAYQSVSGGGGG